MDGAARHALGMADRLRAGIGASNSARLAWSTTSNEVFAIIKEERRKDRRGQGREILREWPILSATPDLVGPDEILIRLVTASRQRKRT